MFKNAIAGAFQILANYCEAEGYKGWDVFDGLNSVLFQRSFLAESNLCKLAWIQFFKRSPLNFRKIAKVPKEYNPKSLGLFASGMVVLGRMGEAQKLLALLLSMTCREMVGVSWGYNFPWMARAFYVPVGKPNMVTTVFAANAFLDYAGMVTPPAEGTLSPDECRKIVIECCEFILKELIIFEDREFLCFGYIPGEIARVYNANMLGAALLGRVYEFTRNKIYYEKSHKAMHYAIKALNPDYAWPYGERSHHNFIDSFHTGFNLVALHDWIAYTGDRCWVKVLKYAYAYYIDNFWLPDGCPKYYHNSLYPIDIHCSAQGIITCLKLKEYDDRSMDLAEKIALWAIKHMQSPEGFFYYQQMRFFTNKIPYMRWSQAWMFYALAHYLAHSLR